MSGQVAKVNQWSHCAQVGNKSPATYHLHLKPTLSTSCMPLSFRQYCWFSLGTFFHLGRGYKPCSKCSKCLQDNHKAALHSACTCSECKLPGKLMQLSRLKPNLQNISVKQHCPSPLSVCIVCVCVCARARARVRACVCVHACIFYIVMLEHS